MVYCPSTLIWASSLVVMAWDFVQLQGIIYCFGVVNTFGLSLSSIGLSMRLVGKRTLGRYYSYGLKPPDKPIKHGIYNYMRYPIYLAMLLYPSGSPLIFSSTYGFLPTLGFTPLILYRIRIEERVLIRSLGDEYREYMKQTRKPIPFFH